MKKIIDIIQSDIEVLMAIETLEYHNKNFLSGSEGCRNESKREILMNMSSQLKSLELKS